MPQDLFKWEDQGGLKHHCPICQAPLSHDKCRTVCLGNHVEWCHRYHCLFRKNWSSRCSACKTADEQHEKRHREIAEILSKIKEHIAEEEAAALQLVATPVIYKSPRTLLTVKALSSIPGPDEAAPETPKTSKRERKAAKKAAKALDRDKVVTSADIQFVAKVLHPNGNKSEEQQMDEFDMEEATEEKDILANLKFNNSTCNSKSARHNFILKERERPDLDDIIINGTLTALEVDPKAAGKEGKLVGQLVEAIKNDLIHFHDELRQAKRNRDGFWRWANKRAWREVQDDGKEWDARRQWERKPEEERRDSKLFAVTEVEDDTEVSRNGSVDSSVAESAGTGFTFPSSQASSFKKPAVLVTETRRGKTAATTPSKSDPGWTKVGKEVLEPPTKLTFSSNGGLHHFTGPQPKNYWTLKNQRWS